MLSKDKAELTITVFTFQTVYEIFIGPLLSGITPKLGYHCWQICYHQALYAEPHS